MLYKKRQNTKDEAIKNYIMTKTWNWRKVKEKSWRRAGKKHMKMS